MTFLVALILTTLFASINLRNSKVADKNSTFAQDGAINLSMQKQPQSKVDVQKGTTGLPLQRITPTPMPATVPPPATAGTGNTPK
jgi:hypothetical protein